MERSSKKTVRKAEWVGTEETVKEFKVRKANGIDGMTAEMTIYRDVVVERMFWVCNLAWK